MQPKLFKVTPSKWGDFEQRDFVAKKTYLKSPQIFTATTVNICGMHKSKGCFRVSLDMLGEINLQSFVSVHQIFSFENCHLGKKRNSKVVGNLEKFWKLGEETFSDRSKSQTPCEMAIIDTFQ